MNSKFNKILFPIIISIILAIIDQITKYIIVKNMTPYKDEISLIGDALVLRYIKNSGAAWGSFASKTLILTILSLFLIALLIYLYHNIIDISQMAPLRLCMIFIIGGAIGNLIDRIRLGYVVDFIYIKLINFPIFNFADICVTVSMFIAFFLCIFKYDNSDIDLLLGTKSNKTSKEDNIDD